MLVIRYLSDQLHSAYVEPDAQRRARECNPFDNCLLRTSAHMNALWPNHDHAISERGMRRGCEFDASYFGYTARNNLPRQQIGGTNKLGDINSRRHFIDFSW